MGSLTRRLRSVAARTVPTEPDIRIIGYGSPGIAKIQYAKGGPPPGRYAAADLHLSFSGEPAIEFVEVLERAADWRRP